MISGMLMQVMFVLLSFFQTSHLIEWKENSRLTWNDFQGRVDTASPNAALTHSAIHAQFGYDDKELEFSIRCHFDKNKSWGRIKNDHILGHEQGHFDLTEIFARKLYQDLKEYKFNGATVDKDINTIYGAVVRDLKLMQLSYDRETDHSRNLPEQERWEQKIDSLLTASKPFSNYKQPMTR